jgi:hypothetical protein
MKKFKKVVEIQFTDTLLGNYANSLRGALFYPIDSFCTHLFLFFAYTLLLAVYPLFVLIVLIQYYFQRKVRYYEVRKR